MFEIILIPEYQGVGSCEVSEYFKLYTFFVSGVERFHSVIYVWAIFTIEHHIEGIRGRALTTWHSQICVNSMDIFTIFEKICVRPRTLVTLANTGKTKKFNPYRAVCNYSAFTCFPRN